MLGLLFLVLLLAILVLVALTYARTGEGSSSKRVPRTAQDVESDSVSATSIVELPLGSTGIADAEDDTGFVTVLSTKLRTREGENRLSATVSGVTDILGVTLIETGGTALGTSSVTFELAEIQMRVLVDGEVAEPGTITFDETARIIALEAASPVLLFDLYETTGAHAFTFLSRRVCPGCHTVRVQARAVAAATLINPTLAVAGAAIGPRTLLVTPSHDASLRVSSSSSSSSSVPSSLTPAERTALQQSEADANRSSGGSGARQTAL